MTNRDKCLPSNLSCHVVHNRLYFSYLSAKKFISQQAFLECLLCTRTNVGSFKFVFLILELNEFQNICVDYLEDRFFNLCHVLGEVDLSFQEPTDSPSEAIQLAPPREQITWKPKCKNDDILLIPSPLTETLYLSEREVEAKRPKNLEGPLP